MHPATHSINTHRGVQVAAVDRGLLVAIVGMLADEVGTNACRDAATRC
jgi:hypothetical protein